MRSVRAAVHSGTRSAAQSIWQWLSNGPMCLRPMVSRVNFAPPRSSRGSSAIINTHKHTRTHKHTW